MDLEKIEVAVQMILEAIGEDPKRSEFGIHRSAWRACMQKFFPVSEKDPADHAKVIFHEDTDEIVLVKDIPFYSTCEHHLVPFLVWGISLICRKMDR